MAVTRIDSNAFLYPMPMALVGAVVGGKPNFLAVGWIARVNFKPPLIGISLGRHHTNRGIEEQKAFSVNIPGTQLIEKTDYCGIVSGDTKDKSGLFDLFYGDLKGAPLIRDCPISMACRLYNTVKLPSDTLFIGEIVEAYADERCLTEGKPDIGKIKPFMLSMPDNNYWAVGDRVGKAWGIGETLKRANP